MVDPLRSGRLRVGAGRFTSSGIVRSRRIWHLSRPARPGWLPRLHRAGPSASLDATPGIAPAGTQTARLIVDDLFQMRARLDARRRRNQYEPPCPCEAL